MSKIIAHAKLPLHIDVVRAQAEVTGQLSRQKPHHNTAHYTGDWTVISLRSPGGKAENIVADLMGDEAYADSELMCECPAIQAFVQSLHCPIMSVRFLNLKVGAIIKEHRDADLAYEKGEARLHIPLFTNKQVEFYVQGDRVQMEEGESWYINANLPHRVSNFGETDRIHLVIDCQVNDWVKTIFQSAEITIAKQTSARDETQKIINELRRQNTETSNQLADQFELQLNTVPASEDENFLQNWLPYKIVKQDDQLLLQWLYVNDQKFTDPFFDETISKCKKLPQNSSKYKSVCELEMIKDWSNTIEAIKPTAFIFHVSRCGSTLVSQLLALNEENISLSEVPIFDEILRLPFKHGTDEKTANELLRSAVKFHGAKRIGDEKTLFIKADSWHLLFYQQLRSLYPSVPFVILYRNPSEVLFSQQRQQGMHAVAGLIEHQVFGFDEDLLNNISPEHYMSLVLEKYFEAIIQIADKDNNLLLVNYSQGMQEIMNQIAEFVSMPLTDTDEELFIERSRFHAKKSTEIFAEKYTTEPLQSPNMQLLEGLHSQVEKRRLKM